MKKRNKLKIQKNNIAGLKNECRHLLQDKRTLQLKLESQNKALEEITSLTDALLINIVLNKGEIVLDKVDVTETLNKYQLESVKEENKIILNVKSK